MYAALAQKTSMQTALAGAGVHVSIMFSAQRVYEHDLISARYCTAMSINGMRVDVERAKEYSSALAKAELQARKDVEDALGIKFKLTKAGGLGTKALHDHLFRVLKAPIYFRSEKTKKPALDKNTLAAWAINSSNLQLSAFACAEIKRRSIHNIKTKYVDGILKSLKQHDRLHPTWKNYSAVTGRFGCSNPNLMNLPRPENDPTALWSCDDKTTRKLVGGTIRGMYQAPEGRMLVWLDMGQTDPRVAAYASGDESMIASCESADIHSANAEMIFGAAFTSLDLKSPKRKAMRVLAKSAGLAAIFLAGEAKLYATLSAAGMKVPITQCAVMLRALHEKCAGYFKWQNDRYALCMREGYSYSPLLMRRRWFGHTPQAAEVINFPIQSGTADIMNAKMHELMQAVECANLDALLVAQVHDSVVLETRTEHVDALKAIMYEVFSHPIMFGERACIMPIDIEVSERWF